jgi:hypothetical protein
MAAAVRTLGFDLVSLTDSDLRAMQRAVRDFSARLTPGGVGLF